MVSDWDSFYMVSTFLRNCPAKARSTPDPYKHCVGWYGYCFAQCHDLTGWECGCFQCVAQPLADCQKVADSLSGCFFKQTTTTTNHKNMPDSFICAEHCEENFISSDGLEVQRMSVRALMA